MKTNNHIRTSPFRMEDVIIIGRKPSLIDRLHEDDQIEHVSYIRELGLKWYHFRAIYRIIKVILNYYR